MKTGFVYLRPTPLVYVRSKGHYRDASQRSWSRLFHWMDRHKLRGVVRTGYGLCQDDPRVTPANECRYDACIELPDHLSGSDFDDIAFQRLPSGAFARKRFVGPHESIGTAMRELRAGWCGNPGIAIAHDRPALEIYLDDPLEVAPERLRTDLCLPIVFVERRDVA